MKVTGCIDLWKKIASFHVNFLDVELIFSLNRGVFITQSNIYDEALLGKQSNGFQTKLFWQKRFIIDIRLGSEYASAKLIH